MKLGNRLTESKDIAKAIGYFLKEKGKSFGLKQETWAEKISNNEGKEMTQGNLNSYLNGIRTSPDIEVYWSFAKAIPISRSEFDKIVEEAKQKVLGTGPSEDKDPLHSLAEKEKLTPGQLEKVKSFIQFVKTQE